MEGMIAIDPENYGVGDNKITGENMIKSSKVGSVRRKGLTDISNLKQQQQPTLQKQDLKQEPSLLMTNEYVEKLQKENMTLMKLVAARNRIIELSGIELQKLRTNFQKLQQQNMQLAQANTQMMAELNSGKDRLKVLQHELACKNGLLISRKLDLEKEKAAACQTGEVGIAECDEAKESMHSNKYNRPCKTNRRRQSKRESCVPSVVQPELLKVEGKRPCLRRQSARFKTEEPIATEDSSEIENSSSVASQCKEIAHEDIKTSLSSSKREVNANAAEKCEAQECRRSSVGRPLRRAAEKIQSYKEIPINIKMRREG